MIEFNLPDMSCGHCVGTVTETVKLVDPAAKVDVDLASKCVKIDSTEAREAFAEALTDAGYTPVAR